MNRTLSLLVACPGLAVLADVTLSTRYEPERSFRSETEASFQLETTAFEVRMDGQPMGARGGGGGAVEEVRTVVQVDRVLEVADGVPSRLTRHFETLSLEGSMEFGDDGRDFERAGALQGRVLELTRDEEGAVAVEVIEGDPPDESAVLEELKLELASDGLLPDEAVAIGDTWELSDESLDELLALLSSDSLFPAPEREEDEGEGRRGRGRGGRRRGARESGLGFLRSAEWQGQAELVATGEEHEGETCAVIDLKITAAGELAEPEETDRERGPGPRSFRFGAALAGSLIEGSFEVALEGKLFVSTDRGRPVHLSLEGDVSTERTSERERGGRQISMYRAQSGRIELQTRVTE